MDDRKRYSGTWYNQHGSSMELSISETGAVSGKFRSGVGLSHRDEQFDVTGFVAGEVISFVVDFSKYETLTTWTGHFVSEDGGPQIQAMWHMAVATPPRHGRDLWKGTWAGGGTAPNPVAEVPAKRSVSPGPRCPTREISDTLHGSFSSRCCWGNRVAGTIPGNGCR